jgi:hypothetical protein
MWRTHSCVPRSHSWERMSTGVAVLASITSVLHAGPISIWQLKETIAAPILVTGQVISIQKGDRIPPAELAWQAETYRMTAEVRVLRTYTSSGKPLETDRLRVNFLQYGPDPTSTNGFPPPLPNFETGKAIILPLAEHDNSAQQSWKLLADEGANAILPARAELPDTGPRPTTARAFILREICNALARGTPAEVFAESSYISTQDQNLTPELMPLLEAAIGNNRERWAEVGTSLIAATGIPRPTISELMTRNDLEKQPGRDVVFTAQAALRKLKPTAETDSLVIKTLIADAPVHAWGSTQSLLEYAENPVLTETLRQALKDGVAGSSYIAFILARNGHKAVLPDALVQALRVCDHAGVGFDDLQGAAATLRDYGSDRQLDQLAALVRKYQTLDRQFYTILWQYSTESDNPREARVLSVVLNDREVLHDGLRVCDFAVGVLERATKENFTTGATSRDDVLARARAWLDAHGIPR